jgi:ABC-type Fe3+ transport system permease subunit
MTIGIWMIGILLLGLTPPLLALILCLILIKKNSYKKLSKKQIYAGFWRATGNFYLTVISALIIFIGFLMIAFTSRKQGFHNLISRTLCIKIK